MERDAADTVDVAASRRGDGEAYRRLVERHQNDVAALMSRFTRDGVQLEELVHDVFVEAWRSLRGFDVRRPFLPWLRTVAVHVGYRHWKRAAREKVHVPLDEIGEMAGREEPSSEEADELVYRLLARLPDRDRLVLTLIYLDGRSVAETAALTGWSKVMVKVQAHRARAKLARLVGRMQGERTKAP